MLAISVVSALTVLGLASSLFTRAADRRTQGAATQRECSMLRQRDFLVGMIFAIETKKTRTAAQIQSIKGIACL